MKNQLNKQQLANLIWKSADEMRGNVDAVKYKDYIFGIMFYKFLSEKEIDFFKSNGFNDNDLVELTDENEDARSLAQNNIAITLRESIYLVNGIQMATILPLMN